MRETADRLAQTIVDAGLRVFARIDHAANAAAAGLELNPMELLIFGNPRGGTPLMQDNPACGIDLPVKALVWQDREGRVWLTYNDAQWLLSRHGLSAGTNATIDAIGAGLAKIASTAARLGSPRSP